MYIERKGEVVWRGKCRSYVKTEVDEDGSEKKIWCIDIDPRNDLDNPVSTENRK